MSAPQLIHDTPNFVFWELPLGKPDPNAVCSPETLKNDTRPRVRQEPPSGHCCIFGAFNSICERIGKHPTAELTEQRDLEMRWSSLRKAIAKHATSWSIVLDPSQKNHFLKWDHENIHTVLSDSKLKEVLERKKPEFIQHLKNFAQQETYKNFYTYASHIICEQRTQIDKTFLESFGKNPETMPNEVCKEPNYLLEETCLGEETQQERLLTMLAIETYAEAYGLRKSSWTPFQEVGDLISELKQRGPLVIGGIFGRTTYSEDPFKMKEPIGQRSVYAWRSGTKINRMGGHAITIIGARKYGDTSLVYYVDPNDPSDPNDITLQKIYAISYRSLKENVMGCRVMWTKHIVPSPHGYAWAAKKAPTSS